MHSAHSTEENQTESNQLHFVQLYERKPDRIERTAAFCTLLLEEYGNKCNF